MQHCARLTHTWNSSYLTFSVFILFILFYLLACMCFFVPLSHHSTLLSECTGENNVDLVQYQGLEVKARAFTAARTDVLLYENASTLVDGVAEFLSLAINDIDVNYTIEFDLVGWEWSVNSTFFDVTQGPPRRLHFLVEPSEGVTVGGEVLPAQPVVSVTDHGNNLIPQEVIDRDTLKMVLELSDTFDCGGSITNGDDTQNIEDSIATFSDLTINTACYLLTDEAEQRGYRFKVSINSLPDVFQYSELFQVIPGEASNMRILQPAADTAYQAMEVFVVQAAYSDLGGNVAAGVESPMEISIASPADAEGKLFGNLTVVPEGGIATFNLQIDKAGEEYVLQVNGSDFQRNSRKIDINVGDFVGIEFKNFVTEYPAGEIMGERAGGPLAVHLVDSGGNTVVSEAPREIRLSLLIGSGSGDDIEFSEDSSLLIGTLELNTTNGVALFDDIQMSIPGSSFVLLARGTLLGQPIEIMSDQFSVVPGAPTLLTYVVPPPNRELQNFPWNTTVVEGVLRGLPVVNITDSQDNLVDTLSTPLVNVSYMVGNDTVYEMQYDLDLRHCVLEALVAVDVDVELEGELRVPILGGTCTWKDVSSRGQSSDVLIRAKLVGVDQFGVQFDDFAFVLSDRFESGLGEFTKLAFIAQPSGGVANEAWAQFPVVNAQDRAGNVHGKTTKEVFLSLLLIQRPGSSEIITDPSEIPLEFTRMNGESGVYDYASKKDQVVNEASGQAVDFRWPEAGLYRLRAKVTNESILVDSEPFNIEIGKDVALRFRQQPGGGLATELWTQQPEVAIMDLYGNAKIDDSSTRIRVSLNNTKGAVDSKRSVELFAGGSKTPVTSMILSQGIALFQFSMDAAGTGYTLVAEQLDDNGKVVKSVESSPFAITINIPHKLNVERQPGSVPINELLQPQPIVTVRDEGDNVYNLPLNTSLGVTLSRSGPTLNGTLSLSSDAGYFRFKDLYVDKISYNVTLQFQLYIQQDGLPPIILDVDSELFDILPAVPTRLEFTTLPSGGLATEAFWTAPTVTLYDTVGDVLVGESSLNVTLDLFFCCGNRRKPNEYNTFLSGQVTRTLEKGVVTFDGLSINKVGNFTIRAKLEYTGPRITKSYEGVPIYVGPPTHVSFVRQPKGGPGVGELYSKLPTQPRVAILDRGDNVVDYVDGNATAFLSLYSVPNRTIFPELEEDGASALDYYQEGGFQPMLLVDDSFADDPRNITLLGQTNITFVEGWANFTDIAIQWAYDGIGSGWRFLLTTEENTMGVAANDSISAIQDDDEETVQLNFSVISNEFTMSAPIIPPYIDIPKELQQLGEALVTINNIIGSAVVIVGSIVLAHSVATSGGAMVSHAAAAASTTASSTWQLLFNYIIYLQMFIVGVQHNDQFEDAWPLFSSMRVFQGNIASEDSVPFWAAWSHCLAIKGITFLSLTVVALILPGFYVQSCFANFYIRGNLFLPLYLILYSPLLESVLETPGEDLWYVSIAVAGGIILMLMLVVSTAVRKSFNSEHNRQWRWLIPEGDGYTYIKAYESDSDDEFDEEDPEGKKKRAENSPWNRTKAWYHTWGCRCHLYAPKSKMQKSLKRIEEKDWKRRAVLAEEQGKVRNEKYVEMLISKRVWVAYFWRPMFEQVVWYPRDIEGLDSCIDRLRSSLSHYIQFIKLMFLTGWVCAAVLLDGYIQNFALIGIICAYMILLLVLVPYKRPFMQLEFLFGCALVWQQISIFLVLENPDRVWALISTILMLLLVVVFGICFSLYFKPPKTRDDVDEFILKREKSKINLEDYTYDFDAAKAENVDVDVLETDAVHYLRLARIYWETGGSYRREKQYAYSQYAQAAKLFQMISIDDPRQEEPLAFLGLIELMHDPESLKARRFFRAALKLNATNKEAGVGLTNYYLRHGKVDKAAAIYNRAIMLAESKGDAQWALESRAKYVEVEGSEGYMNMKKKKSRKGRDKTTSSRQDLLSSTESQETMEMANIHNRGHGATQVALNILEEDEVGARSGTADSHSGSDSRSPDEPSSSSPTGREGHSKKNNKSKRKHRRRKPDRTNENAE